MIIPRGFVRRWNANTPRRTLGGGCLRPNLVRTGFPTVEKSLNDYSVMEVPSMWPSYVGAVTRATTWAGTRW